MLKSLKLLKPFFLILHVCILINCSAQTNAAPQKTAVANTKLIVTIGNYKTGSKVSVTDFKKMIKIDPTIVLKDEKGNAYTIVSFELTWRQKSIADDVITGKPKTSYTAVGQKIKGSKINEDWVDEINETLNMGDKISFSSILYFDVKKHKVFIAPDLLIDIL